MNTPTVPCFAWLMLLSVGACSSPNSSDVGGDATVDATVDASVDAYLVDHGLSVPSLNAPLSISLSDMPGVSLTGLGDVDIYSLPLGADPRSISFSVTAWTLDERFIGRTTSSIDSAILASLASGERVEIPEINATGTRAAILFQTPSGTYERRVLSAQLRLESSVANLVLELGPREDGEGNITMEIRGQYPVYCSLVEPQGVRYDPMWASDFCQETRAELGLDAWIEAMR